MAEIKSYTFPWTDLTPGQYRLFVGDAKQGCNVTVENNLGMHHNTKFVVRFKIGYYPSSLRDLPASARLEEIPAEETIVEFGELQVGDRFQHLNEDGAPVVHQMWTKLDCDTARHHEADEIKRKERSYGYLKAAICSFKPNEKVKFVPVVLP